MHKSTKEHQTDDSDPKARVSEYDSAALVREGLGGRGQVRGDAKMCGGWGGWVIGRVGLGERD